MSEPTFDSTGNLHLGPYGAPRAGRITVDFSPDEAAGVALDVKEASGSASARAVVKLGDYVFGQDPAQTGSVNFGIATSAGVLIAELADANARANLKSELYGITLPLILAPTGSMGNNGALTSGTANPMAYTDSYVWLPTAAIFTASPAGWYYAHWSDTTHATIYQNTWDGASNPTAPASPTAWVKTGPGAFTGPTTAAVYLNFPVAAARMSVNTIINVKIDYGLTNNANAKTAVARFSAIGGTALWTDTLTSNVSAESVHDIAITGEANKQRVSGWMIGGTTATLHSRVIGADNTTAAWSLALAIARADATDVIAIEMLQIDINR